MSIFSAIFSSANDKQIKRLSAIADKIEALSDSFAALTDQELKGYTLKLKQRLSSGESTDALLPEAFACVREASGRVLKMRHFKVQLMGGIALHEGRIAEMFTGEGKTLVATLPAYLNALTGKGVHVVTVNEYLARRDAEWMGKLYRFLGLTVGIIYSRQPAEEKRAAYRCDITYGTNSEFGFDYLLDNMVRSTDALSQRELSFAIVDEVDSILIDEARTPLIISGMSSNEAEGYLTAAAFARTLSAPQPDAENEEDRLGDFEIDEEVNRITLTVRGMKRAEEYYGIENIADDISLYRNIRFAVKAQFLMQRDVDYVVTDGEVIIVDEFTGRLMIGRRYNEGLHQAIEAKEGVKIRNESKTYASITFQNFFRLYDKLSGMTGTAKTEEQEFREIYGVDVTCIPTNAPIMREDLSDRIYLTAEAKLDAVVAEVLERHTKGQPVLVGTQSVAKSEQLSEKFKQAGIPYNLLNAKNHREETFVVAQAGRKGTVTIATNMAGRGTDIMPGGNPDFLAKQALSEQGISDELIAEATSFAAELSPEVEQLHKEYQKLYEQFKAVTDADKAEVLALGGLCVIGTEKHENRRIDNQLRGRSGRQGDPGTSVFFLSCEDDLLRINAGENFANYLAAKRFPADAPIQDKYVCSKVLEAQKYIEGRNFSTRKMVLSYDDVLNNQREIIYGDRRKVLFAESVHEKLLGYFPDVVSEIVQQTVDFRENFITWDYNAINSHIEQLLMPAGTNSVTMGIAADMKIDSVIDAVLNKTIELYEQKAKDFDAINGQGSFAALEKSVLLAVIDSEWITQMDEMENLRNCIGLRAIGQNDPVTCYQIDGMKMFDEMVWEIKRKAVLILTNPNNAAGEGTEGLKVYPKDVLISAEDGDEEE